MGTNDKEKSKPVEICTLLTTTATLLLVVFTAFQISRYANSMKADFAHKIKVDFFNEKERMLMFLFNNDLLEFKVLSDSSSNYYLTYFSLNKEKAKLYQNDSIKLLNEVKESYSTLEVEDILLNHFEDLNLYSKNNVISPEYLYNGFSAYLNLIYENSEIQKLIQWLNSTSETNDSYIGIKELYDFTKAYEKRKYK